MAKQALNTARMKERNYSRFFRELRFNPMTRSQVARQMDLTRAATSIIAEDMLTFGIIREGPLVNSGRYSSKTLFWNKDFFHVGAVNLGRESVKVGLTDFCSQVIDSAVFPVAECKNGAEAIYRAAHCLKQMLIKNNPPGELLGVGVASPGPLDVCSGIILDPPYYELMQNCPVVSMLRGHFNCDIILENDANAMALAERCYGLQDRYERFLELMVDIGIGASLILDGRLHRGPSGLGNGFGHTSINMNGPKCDCGNRGCVEMYAAIPRIVNAARRIDPSLCNWKEIVDRAYTSEPAALEVLRNEALYLAMLIVNASNLLDIQAVIFAGEEVLYRPDILLSEINREVNSRITSRRERSVAVLSSQIPDNAKVLCCVNLIIEKYMTLPIAS